MKELLIWILEHPRLLPLILLLMLLAFIAGQAVQYCEDDKKSPVSEATLTERDGKHL